MNRQLPLKALESSILPGIPGSRKEWLGSFPGGRPKTPGLAFIGGKGHRKVLGFYRDMTKKNCKINGKENGV